MRWRVLTVAAVALVVALSLSSANAVGGSRISWQGGNWFLLGANYPWLNYGHDFGCNAWGCDGVSTGGSYDADLAALQGHGVHVMRWFVFGDGRAGIDYAPNGTPLRAQQKVYDDFDRALQLAASHQIYLDVVLFDFILLKPAETVSGVQLFGRSALMTDAAKRTALVTNVVQPLLTRYKNQPYVLAWEVMNEPEWAISDLPEPSNQMADPMTLAQFYDFAHQVADSVHARTAAYVTIGSASLKWHRVWTNAFADSHSLPRLNLDFYQTHYYPWMDPYGWTNHPELGTTRFSPLQQNYNDLALDKPMVVGEFEAPSGQAQSRLDTIYANGYAGAWPWSSPAVDWTAFSAWEAAHASDVRIPAASSVPTPQPVPTVASVGGFAELPRLVGQGPDRSGAWSIGALAGAGAVLAAYGLYRRARTRR